MNKSKLLTTSDMEKYFIKRILLLYTTARKHTSFRNSRRSNEMPRVRVALITADKLH